MRDALRELRADAVGAGDHRAVAARERALQLADLARRQDGEGGLGADALAAGQPAEPVAFLGAGEADHAQELLSHPHFGVDGALTAACPQSPQPARRAPTLT